MGGSHGRPPGAEELETLRALRCSLDFVPAEEDRQGTDGGGVAERDELLSRLSTAVELGEPECTPWPVPDPRWESIGFQGPDPRKDLRGYPRLALEQLCSLFESGDHGSWARSAATRLSAGLDGDPARILPFCAASIAATELLATSVGVVPDPMAACEDNNQDSDTAPWWALLSSRDQFDAAHAVTLRCLIREWMPPRGPGQYMDFSRAREAARGSLTRALRAGPAEAAELAAILGFLGLDGRWAKDAPGSPATPTCDASSEQEELVPQMAGQLRYYPAGWTGEISIFERALSASTRADRRVRWRVLRVCIKSAPDGSSGVLDWSQAPQEEDGGGCSSDASPPCELAGRARLSASCRAACGLADGSAAEHRFLTLFMPGGLPPVMLRALKSSEVREWLAALSAAGVDVESPAPASSPAKQSDGLVLPCTMPGCA